MALYSKEGLKDLKSKYNNELNSLIKSKNFSGFAEVLNRICGVIVINDYQIDDEFINAVKSNRMSIYGDWEVRAYGKIYAVNWQGEEVREKEVPTACGETVKVKYVVCNKPHDSQVPDAFSDILTKNIDKQVTLFINRDELRNIACGDGTFDQIVNLIMSKLNQATADAIYETILCALNDSRNYKKIVELEYCCESCDGRNFLSAINTFALQMQRNTSDYNIQSRDYNLPINQMWLLKSYDIDSRIYNILSGKFKGELVDIQNKFNNSFPLDLKIADLIICDKQWIQFHEALNESEWENSVKMRGMCGIANYIARFKLVNFMVGVPIKLKKVDCAKKLEADMIRQKIEAETTPIEATSQSEAETKATAIINAAKGTSTLKVATTYRDYKASTVDLNGSIKADIVISDENNVALTRFTKLFILSKLKPNLNDLITVKALGEIADKTAATIIAKVKELNSTAPNDIQVDGTPTDTQATIKSASATGTVTVTYTLPSGDAPRAGGSKK